MNGFGAEPNSKQKLEAYLGPYQTFMMECYCEIVND